MLYPTLLELCGLPPDAACDGKSITPLLRDPQTNWQRPALMTYMRGNHAVRRDRWRYIRYADGTEELYDHQTDPNEWNNLIGNRSFDELTAQHRKWLPETESPQIPDLKKPSTKPTTRERGRQEMSHCYRTGFITLIAIATTIASRSCGEEISATHFNVLFIAIDVCVRRTLATTMVSL